MSKIKVNTIAPRSGTTVTLGEAGDTIALGACASQTGFGRTGTVDWQTGDIKTAAFIPATGKGYFVNTTGGAVTVNLPAGTAGDIIGLKDYAGTWDDNAITLNPNGSDKIGGGNSADPTVENEGGSLLLVYVDTTQGWLTTQQSVTTSPSGAESFITASGGNTVITSGDYKTHIFTGDGTFTVSAIGSSDANSTVDYLVVGGGGGARANGGGAGAGGFRTSNAWSLPAPTTSPLAAPTGIVVTATAYSVTVGGGGPGAPSAANGVASTFSTITSAGGGVAGGQNPGDSVGGPGGSGGGGDYNTATKAGGTGNTPPVSPPQGQNGGDGSYCGSPTTYSGGGGGGAGEVGGPGLVAQPNTGHGGNGSYLDDTFFGPTAPSYGTPGTVSSTRYFAGGGASDCFPGNPGTIPAGEGGGGQGGGSAAGGTVNTGGGGGGSNSNPAPDGGSGVVMIRYKYQ